MNPTPALTNVSVNINPLGKVRVLRSAGSALFAQALLHGQLAHIEWEEEKNRLLKMLVIALLGFACFLGALLFTGALVLAATWETAYRIHAVACLVLVYGFGTAVAWWRFQVWAALGDQAFAASREELAADAVLLKEGL